MRQYQNFYLSIFGGEIFNIFEWACFHNEETYLGPVVQSSISLTSLLMTNSLTVVDKVCFKYIDIFAAKKWSRFCTAKVMHNFSAKISMYLPYFKIEILT